MALQAEARARLAKTRANFVDGMRVAKEVQRDLEWTQRKAQYVVWQILAHAVVTDKILAP